MKRIIALLLVLTLVVALVGCSREAPDEEASDNSGAGTDDNGGGLASLFGSSSDEEAHLAAASNIQNGGQTAVDGDSVYITAAGPLKKTQPGETDGEPVDGADQILAGNQIAVDDGWLYYISVTGADENGALDIANHRGASINRVNLENGEAENVFRSDSANGGLMAMQIISMQVYDGWVYFTSIGFGMIRAKTDGSEAEQIYEEAVAFFDICDDRIYFDDLHGSVISMDLDGSNEEIITDELESGNNKVIVCDDWVYCASVSNQFISRVSVDGGEVERIDDFWQYFAISDGRLYYTKVSDDRLSLYSSGLDGSDINLIETLAMAEELQDAAKRPMGLYVVDDWIYIFVASPDGDSLMIRKDNEEITKFKMIDIYR